MKQKQENNFIKGVEKLVDPIEVGSIHFLFGLNKLLPIKLQNYLSSKSSEMFPYMGFVVEPYSSFLFYEIKNIEKAQAQLPNGFKIIKTKVLKNDEAKYYAIFGAFRAHTSAFWGSRLEFYIIAEDTKTGLLSWIIVDYDSNTIGQDKKYGLREPNAKGSVITINHRGELLVDLVNKNEDRQLSYNFNVEDGKMAELDPKLWIEGNLSVAYGKDLNGSNSDVFGLQFETCEMEKALVIPSNKFSLLNNSWNIDFIEKTPDLVLCFPYAQHFISDSPGHNSSISNEEDLNRAVSSLNFDEIKAFSVKEVRSLILLQNAITVFLMLLVVYLIIF